MWASSCVNPRTRVKTVKLAASVVTVYRSVTRQDAKAGHGKKRGKARNISQCEGSHRFEQYSSLFGCMDGWNEILAIFCIVTRCHIKLFVAYVRSDYLQISRSVSLSCEGTLKTVAQSAFPQPKGQAGAYFRRESEQFLSCRVCGGRVSWLLRQCEVFVELDFFGKLTVDTQQAVTAFHHTPI